MRYWTNSVLIAVSTLASMIGFLVLDRLYSSLFVTPPATVLCVITDPVRHHALRPNCAGSQAWGRTITPKVTNSLGLIDSEIREVILRSAKPRILMLGDSFTAGAGVPWTSSF